MLFSFIGFILLILQRNYGNHTTKPNSKVDYKTLLEPASVAQLDARLTGCVFDSTRSGNILSWRLTIKYFLLLDECLLSCQCTFNIGLIQGQGEAGFYGYNATRYFPVYRLRLIKLYIDICFLQVYWIIAQMVSS